MIARLRHRLRADDGFSLIELMAAMAIGSVVLTACMGIFMSGVKATTQIQNRVDNAGRARYALDRVVRLLDSQVCTQLVALSDVQTPPIFSGSSDNSVTFYGDLDGASGTPEKYVISFVRTGTAPGAITVDKYAYNTTSKAWSDKVGGTDRLVTDVVPLKDAAGVEQPVFTYYPFIGPSATDASTIGNVSTTPAATPLSAAVAPTIVKVGVQFAAVSSTSHADDKSHAYVSGSGALNTFNADPTAPTACP